jgi:hypothetical protein
MFHRYGQIMRQNDQMYQFEAYQGWFDGPRLDFPAGGPADLLAGAHPGAASPATGSPDRDGGHPRQLPARVRRGGRGARVRRGGRGVGDQGLVRVVGDLEDHVGVLGGAEPGMAELLGAAAPYGGDVVARPPVPDVLAVAMELGDQGADIGVVRVSGVDSRKRAAGGTRTGPWAGPVRGALVCGSTPSWSSGWSGLHRGPAGRPGCGYRGRVFPASGKRSP